MMSTLSITEDDCLPQANTEIRGLLETIPFVQVDKTTQENGADIANQNALPDFVIKINVGNLQWQLVVEAKKDGQPKQIRGAILQLKDCLSKIPGKFKYGIFAAPFISGRSADICKEAGIGYLDFAGNCRLCFGEVFIERKVSENPHMVKREFGSLFSPKAGRVLRVLLGQPFGQSWKIEAIQQLANVSIGHVSNVRKLLLDQEWAMLDKDGIKITRPEELLRAWQQAYKPRVHSRHRFYTILNGDNLDVAIRNVFVHGLTATHAVLASFSAARWLAPFARQSTSFFYADQEGLKELQALLKLQATDLGENVIIDVPDSDDAFFDRIAAAPGILTTSLIQTFLDLSTAGERGREAAEHLLQQKLLPLWKKGE